MALASGTRLGPYEIIARIGTGGMGEVYKARDTRLDRTVAIKVLPEHMTQDPQSRQRFEREARAASNLNHPNICVLHDIGRHETTDFLVMEYLEGETLAARIEKGPLPFEQLRRIGIEIAGALDKAHRKGLTHRDLKPGNIMLTKAGAKLLDFGLAKMAPPLSPGAPTVSSPLTSAGSLVGTFQYMSPEQLEDKDADPRSDIFAFGAVLYEMATGRRAFGGKNPASVIAAILGAEPPSLTTVQPAAPPALDRLVKRCLAKDPDERCQSVHDVMLALTDLAAEVVSPPRARHFWRTLFWAMAGVSFIAIIATIYLGRRSKVELPAVELTLLAPEKTIFDSIAVSPDGRRLAFTAIDASGKTRLWVRPLGSLAAQPLDGTEGAMSPFWSPDSRCIAFFADGRLKKIEATGGPLQTLADAADPCLGAFGGAWNRAGAILFPRTHGDPIYRVPATSGKGTPVTTMDLSRAEHGHQWPQFLPDGRHFLYYAWGDNPELQGMRVGSLDQKEPARILAVRSKATYAEAPGGSGYLLFIRDKTLLAQPFDAERMELTGDPLGIIQPVGAFSVSENGVLVYDTGGLGADTQLAWFDRTGRRLGTIGSPGSQACPVLSPDEKRVAVGRDEVWVYETARGIGSRLTFHRGGIPVWSPDGGRIVFESGRDGIWRLYQKLSSGAGEEELLLQTTSREIWPVGWSRDGRFLLYGETNPETHWDLCVLVNPLGPPAERKTIPFLASEFIEDFGQFSPDGDWIAYHSTESGRDEIYVRPFRPDSAKAGGGDDATGGKRQVSRAGGVEPRWRADGQELFYYGIDGTMMAVPVKTGDVFEFGTPQPLFWVRARGYLRYDVTADGKRFIVNTPSGEDASALSVVLNWTAKVKR